jgi:hypothetical protein
MTPTSRDKPRKQRKASKTKTRSENRHKPRKQTKARRRRQAAYTSTNCAEESGANTKIKVRQAPLTPKGRFDTDRPREQRQVVRTKAGGVGKDERRRYRQARRQRRVAQAKTVRVDNEGDYAGGLQLFA